MKKLIFSLNLILILFRIAESLSTGPLHDKVVVCYVGTWSVYRPEKGSFTIEHIDPSLCTHIIYSFVGLDILEDSPKSLDPWQDLTDDYGKGGFQRIIKLKNSYPHLKVTLAIGGWNEGSTNYSRMVSDEKRRKRFVQNALNFIKKYNFDGLDLDWEFPGKRGGVPSDKENFLLLVKELKSEFRKHNLLLTAAFGAGKDTIDVAYDVESLSVYLDFIHMMCYDYHGSWDKKTGPNAPLKSDDFLSVEYTINYMIKLGAPPHKLVMGLPLYGRTFLLEKPVTNIKKKIKLGMPAKGGFKGPFTREDGFMGYNEICLELNNKTANWVKYWDSDSRTPYAVNEDKVISYDNELSLKEKISFGMKENLAGVMVWSVDTDDFLGDCYKNDGSTHRNFPLMRHINKAIKDSLIEIEAENTSRNEVNNEHQTGNSISFHKNRNIISIIVIFCLFKLLLI